MIQKYVIGRWEVYICLLCNKKLGEVRLDEYLASHHDCEHYYWEVSENKKSKKLERKSLVKGHRDNTFYYLLSDVD